MKPLRRVMFFLRRSRAAVRALLIRFIISPFGTEYCVRNRFDAIALLRRNRKFPCVTGEVGIKKSVLALELCCQAALSDFREHPAALHEFRGFPRRYPPS